MSMMTSGTNARMVQSLLKTSVIKDLRLQKEKTKHRKSQLIYGCKDMKQKLFMRARNASDRKKGGDMLQQDRKLQSSQRGIQLDD